MKRKISLISGLFLLLVLLVIISAPLLIKSREVQQQVLERIQEIYIVDASIDDLRFTWLPFPHLTARGFKVNHPRFAATSGTAVFYPTWKIVLGLSSLGRLHVTDPVIEVFPSPTIEPGVEEQGAGLKMPDVHLLIKNGTLLLPGRQDDVLNITPTKLHDIKAVLHGRGRTGTFTWQSGASFAEQITLEGSFDQQGNVQLRGAVSGLRPHDLLAEADTSLLVPAVDSSDLDIQLEKNSGGLEIALQGDMPDFGLHRLASTEIFRLGQGDLVLRHGTGGNLSLALNNLVVNGPQLRLTGEISRYLPSVNADEAHIKIDMQAREIDVTAVRRKVLSLLADSSVAQQVVDIVRSGRALSASYYFDAPVASFEDVTAMTIGVDIAEADIHLADIPLDLTRASGPILIKDGDLTGRDITTWVGDAKGTSGVFLVGLADDKYGLKVDVDIDANLAELPAVLRTLIDDEDVVRELGTVEGRGRARGHLHIGDDLRDYQVRVDVDRYEDAELRYERLSWPVRLDTGRLQVTGSSLQWQGIKAHLASHTITESSGRVNWHDSAVPLAIDSLRGFFDANTLLGELRNYPQLAEALTGIIDAAHGAVELSGTLQGPLFKPEQYIYDVDAIVRNSSFKTPVLPQEVLVEKAHASITDQEIRIQAGKGRLLGHPVSLNGSLFHQGWQGWHGSLQLNGILADKHVNWLRNRDILPRFIAPSPPHRLEKMTITWDDDTTKLSGRVFAEQEETFLDLDITDQAASSTASFQVSSPTGQALFSLHQAEMDEKLTVSFSGDLSGPSLDAFLGPGRITFASMSGDFTLSKRRNQQSDAILLDFSGPLQAENVAWQWGEQNRNVAIPSMALHGNGGVLAIKKMEVEANNESLSVAGTFANQPGAGHLELELGTTSTLSMANIEDFQEDFSYFVNTTLGLDRQDKEPASYSISGLINFDIGGFVIPFGTEEGKPAAAPAYRLPFTPLRGFYQFDQADSVLNLRQSNVCGVEVNGQFLWHGATETSKEVSVMSPVEKPLHFSDVLSCFNFKEIIEGPLNITGRIHSDSTFCKQGGLLFTSEKGTIKKFVALSKVLSLINISGLSGSIWTDGFYYNYLEVSGNICDNIFTIEKAYINGDGVDIVTTGEINLSTMQYDLTFFVVPFSTINSLVTRVPLVGRVVGGKEGRIVSVPVKVTGPITDPKVTLLSPSAIGEATAKWILDTISLPFGWMIPAQERGDDEPHIHDNSPDK